MSTPRTPRVYGVLVTYQRPRHLERHLERLAEQRLRLETLFVVDNAPSDLARDIVCRHQGSSAETRHIPAPENLGPAGGIALGMRHALDRAGPGDWVLLLDDDDPPPPAAPGFLQSLAEFALRMLRDAPETGGVAARGARFDWRSGRLDRLRDEELRGAVPVDYQSGAYFPMYRVDAIRAVGPFRADLFFGFDDLEYGLRLRRAGYRLFAHGELGLEERRRRARLRETSGPRRRQPPPPWRRYYGVRNLVHILRSSGHPLAAARVVARSGLARPLFGLLAGEAGALETARLAVRGALDGWTGRLGRTVTPTIAPSGKGW